MNHPPVGYSLHVDKHDLSDVSPALDEAEAQGVDTVEVPIFGMNLVAGGRLLGDRLRTLAGLLAGRPYRYSVHGVLGINFMDEPWRLPLHEAVARSNIEIAEAIGASHLVIHSGLCKSAQAAEIEAAYARQRDCLARLGQYAREHGVILCVENVFAFRDHRVGLVHAGHVAAVLESIAVSRRHHQRFDGGGNQHGGRFAPGGA